MILSHHSCKNPTTEVALKEFVLNSIFDINHELIFLNLLLTILISILIEEWVIEPIEIYQTCVMCALVILSGCIGVNYQSGDRRYH